MPTVRHDSFTVHRDAGTYLVISVPWSSRGLSRSALDDPAQGVTLAEHADDVHRLLVR